MRISLFMNYHVPSQVAPVGKTLETGRASMLLKSAVSIHMPGEVVGQHLLLTDGALALHGDPFMRCRLVLGQILLVEEFLSTSTLEGFNLKKIDITIITAYKPSVECSKLHSCAVFCILNDLILICNTVAYRPRV